MELILYLFINSIINFTMLEYLPFGVLKFRYKFNKYYALNEIYYAGLTLNNQFYFIVLIFLTLFWRRFIDRQKSPHVPVYIALGLYQTALFALWIKIATVYMNVSMLPSLFFEVFGFSINLLLFYFFNQMEQKLEIEEKLASFYRQRDFEKEYIQTSKQHLEQMQELHNDFASQIHELYETVKRPDYEKNIRQILNRSQEQLDAGRQTVYSLHPVINALLCVKQELAGNKQIDMEIHCTHSSDIGIEDIDICSVLGNLLDNAIEACEKIETDERKIIADIHEKAGFFVVNITNTITSQTQVIKKYGYTSKPDSQNHGLGLRMVERICTKYDGKLILSPSGDIMNASAILKQDLCR